MNNRLKIALNTAKFLIQKQIKVQDFKELKLIHKITDNMTLYSIN